MFVMVLTMIPFEDPLLSIHSRTGWPAPPRQKDTPRGDLGHRGR